MEEFVGPGIGAEACVGVGEVVCKGAASWGKAGESIDGTTVGWDAFDDFICGSARKLVYSC